MNRINKPEVSVIMAVYNGEKYLPTSIKSVLDQSFTNFEFIIIDDNSSDLTKTIIKNFDDKRIIYRKNKKTLGQTSSLNIGLKLAKGEFIARIDADDVFEKNKLYDQFNFMENNKRFAICGSGGVKIDEKGNHIGSYKVPILTRDIIFQSFLGSPLIHVSILMRKKIMDSLGGYDESFIYCADFALWSKAIEKGYLITNLKSSLVKFRIFPDSLGGKNKLGLSGKEATKIIYSNIKKFSNSLFTEEDCNIIVLMLWPASKISITKISEVYFKLVLLLKDHNSSFFQINNKIRVDLLYLKSLVKRWIYLKAKNEKETIKKDSKTLLKNYIKFPRIIFYFFLSRIIAFSFSLKL